MADEKLLVELVGYVDYNEYNISKIIKQKFRNWIMISFRELLAGDGNAR